MMRAQNIPSGTVESAIVEAASHFKSMRIKEFNLGMAPLSNLEIKGVDILTNQFNKFYQYKSLLAFKAKFKPTWIPKYLYLKSPSSLPVVLVAIAQAHLK
jgi:phosphatidylglycerol lysyltransferase